MKVLYVGGTGEISYSCVHESVRAGHAVSVFNRGKNTEPIPAAVRRITGDFGNDAQYGTLGAETWDVVCQFTAYNLGAIERDLKVFGGKVGQYVFISSASCYQKPPTTHVFKETTPLDNKYWPYSQAKTQMEQALWEWHRAGQLPVTVIRPSHTYRRNFPATIGPGDFFAWRMLQGKPTVVHGDGRSLWTLTHSDDFAVPFVRLLGNKKTLGEAYQITSDEVRNWDQITNAIGAALGVEPKIVHVPTETLIKFNPDWVGPLLGDKSWSITFDNAKVKAVAGDWTCKTSTEDGMKRVAEFSKKRMVGMVVDQKLDALFDRIAAAQMAVGAV